VKRLKKHIEKFISDAVNAVLFGALVGVLLIVIGADEELEPMKEPIAAAWEACKR
jgi:hypothetical protein